ncbi:MAG: zf-HC2 domain-containing protein [Pseudomonadota bacterium]
MTENKDIEAEVWELLPWYVNGTLSPEEAAMVEAHLAANPRMAAELAAERRLGASLQAMDNETVGEAAAWARLSRQLGADAATEDTETAPTPTPAPTPAPPPMPEPTPAPTFRGPGLWDRLVGLLQRLVPQGEMRWPTAVASVAAILAVAVVVYQPRQDTAEFVTLTAPAAPSQDGLVEIRVLPAPGTDVEAVRALMAEAGLEGIDGPSEAGLIRGRVAADRATEALRRLSADPGVALAAMDGVSTPGGAGGTGAGQ